MQCVQESQYSKWPKDLGTRNTIYMQCTINFWDCLIWPRLSRMASEPYWSPPDAAEQRALGSSLKDSSFPNKKSLADLLLGKRIFLPCCQIIRLQKTSLFVLGMKWMHLKGKQERDSASNCWVAAQLDTPVSAPDITRAKAEPGKAGLLNAPGGVSSPLGYINLSNWSFGFALVKLGVLQ